MIPIPHESVNARKLPSCHTRTVTVHAGRGAGDHVPEERHGCGVDVPRLQHAVRPAFAGLGGQRRQGRQRGKTWGMRVAKWGHAFFPSSVRV